MYNLHSSSSLGALKPESPLRLYGFRAICLQNVFRTMVSWWCCLTPLSVTWTVGPRPPSASCQQHRAEWCGQHVLQWEWVFCETFWQLTFSVSVSREKRHYSACFFFPLFSVLRKKEKILRKEVELTGI